MVGYFQLEEWLSQQNNRNIESIKKIRQSIAEQNAREIQGVAESVAQAGRSKSATFAKGTFGRKDENSDELRSPEFPRIPSASRPEYFTVSHENPSSTIPKRIIQVWFDKGRKRDHNGRKYPAKFDKYVKSMKTQNPDYEYLFFDKDDAEAFLQETYPQYYRTYLRLPVFIQKIDFFRYVAIYHYGGFYMDLDVKALKPLDTAITLHSAVFPIDEYIVPDWWKDARFKRFHESGLDFLPGQYAFGAIPRHPFIRQLVESIHRNISTYERLVKPGPQYVYSTTGPDFVADEYIQYPKKETLFLLDNGNRQVFGDYGKHDYMGTWK
jgi:mannosyltransferase OCH1-like enzyme